jgi:hypothetical protein
MSRTFVIPEGKHCELGPSGAKRWMRCARSVQATRDLPNENSIFAASGTASHTLSEWCRVQGVKCEEFLDDKLIVGAHSFIVDKARCDSVNRFCEYTYDIGGETFVEEMVYYDHGFGTSDHAAVEVMPVSIPSTIAPGNFYWDTEDRCHIIDFKDGEGVCVGAEWNEQLLHYAMGWWLTYGWLYNVKRFVLHIVQPRLNHFVKWGISLADLTAWYVEKAQPAAEATKDPNAPFNPGPWCSDNFCKLRRVCKARADAMAKAALDNFEGFENYGELGEEAKAKDVTTLTGEQLAKAYDLSKQVKKWLAELQTHVMAEIRSGRDVGGKKLVAGKNARVFNADEEAVVRAVQNEGYDVTTDDLYTKPELKSVAQIEELVGKEAFAPAKEPGKRSPAKPAGPLHALVKKIPGAPTIADKDDPRPAVTLNPMEEFEHLDADEDFLV